MGTEEGRKKLNQIMIEETYRLKTLKQLRKDAFIMIDNESFREHIPKIMEQLDLINDEVDFIESELEYIRLFLTEEEEE